MILFKTVFEKVEVDRVPVPWDIERLGLIGHLPPGCDRLQLDVIGATVAVERGYSSLIYAEAKEEKNWLANEKGFT